MSPRDVAALDHAYGRSPGARYQLADPDTVYDAVSAADLPTIGAGLTTTRVKVGQHAGRYVTVVDRAYPDGTTIPAGAHLHDQPDYDHAGALLAAHRRRAAALRALADRLEGMSE